MAEWENIMSRIEQAAEAMRASGACEKWFAGSDATTRKVRLHNDGS